MRRPFQIGGKSQAKMAMLNNGFDVNVHKSNGGGTMGFGSIEGTSFGALNVSSREATQSSISIKSLLKAFVHSSIVSTDV